MKAIKSISGKDRLMPLLLTASVLFLAVMVFLHTRKANYSTLELYDILAVCESVPDPVFTVPEGIYDQPFELEIQAPAGYTIYYTTDGSIPTIRSFRYQNPITIDPRKNPNKDIMFVRTSLWWRPPFGQQNHCNVVRARCFKDSVGYGKVINTIYSNSQILEHDGFQVVHILMEADSLFSPQRGIYVKGEKYYSKKTRIAMDTIHEIIPDCFYPANYHQRGKNWTRPAEFILTDSNGKTMLEQSIQLCIHGMASRANPLKSLRIVADSVRGDHLIRHRFFNDLPYDTFRSIILRNSGNDMGLTMFRDAMLQQAVKEIGLDIQEYAPAVVYINGNYWSIHNIREKMDENYLAIKYDADLDKIEILDFYKTMTVYYGDVQSSTSFESLVDFIENHSLSDTIAYQYVCEQMDVDNFIDYMIVETFYANLDWAVNNTRLYRIGHQTETMKQKNIEAGKWRWFLIDLDYSVYDTPLMNMFERLKNDFPYFVTTIFFALLENPEFKEKFLTRYEFIINNYMTSQRMLQYIEEFEERYQSEIKRLIARWRRPMLMQAWQSSVDFMKDFLLERPDIVLEQLKAL